MIIHGALKDSCGRFFIIEKAKGSMAGRWEFPGGEALPGEDVQEALSRIWEEVVGFPCKVGELLWEGESQTYYVSVKGPVEPVLSTHKQYRWTYPKAFGCLLRAPSLQVFKKS